MQIIKCKSVYSEAFLSICSHLGYDDGKTSESFHHVLCFSSRIWGIYIMIACQRLLVSILQNFFWQVLYKLVICPGPEWEKQRSFLSGFCVQKTECFIGKRKTSMRQFKLVLISFSSGIFLKESLQFLFPKSSYLNTECY